MANYANVFSAQWQDPSLAWKSGGSFAALLEQAQQSPTIVYLLAQLENNRKQVVLSDGDATYVDTRTGNIVISKSFLVRDDIGALATVLAHEGGHAILKDGTLNFLVARTADDAVHMALMREAVALRAEFCLRWNSELRCTAVVCCSSN